MIERLHLHLRDRITRRAYVAPLADPHLVPARLVPPFAGPGAAERNVPAPTGVSREAS